MKKVLVLGASGYVGSQLLLQLCRKGYHVTAAARQIEYLKARVTAHPNLELIYLDLADQEETLRVVPEYEVIYFLVHGMAHGHDFLEYEISLAEHFSSALKNSHVKHVIYLSAIQPQTGNSEHLKARRMTGDIIRKAGIPVTELRAGVIIGPGSAAFEIMRDFVYNMPLLITPKWVDSKANPIALENLNHYLLSLIEESPTCHALYEVGGPDTLSYREQFETISVVIQKPIKLWSTSLLTPQLASRWLGIITSVPSSIGAALLSGLEHDFIANSEEIHQRYPQALVSYEQMVRKSIAEEGHFVRSEVWGFDPAALKRWQAGYGYYPKQTGASIETDLSSEQLWEVIKQIGSRKEGYFFANLMWRIREWLDLFFGGGRPVRRSPPGPELQVGDYIDSWKVIRCEREHFLSLLFGMKGPGLGRLEFSLEDLGSKRRLIVKAWWHPQGLRGLLYWFAMMPAHLFIFKGMVKAIVRKAKELP
ncbi:DUF2867 domain-containing protein [Vibrio neptunius]|uniref:DUF2867 domain-containing protein n=1 Tax=Vibrio neptunius TaxID=170651 RepID=A0ABS3A0K5_9VIBR|nr:DUF2867 domain-containing protein [Vibrio neptunius]MBN3491816.1 DUF2867 domain-containing protein [Vibrio neptunius]MBN3514489.1 DUF2867 domain-containing protein [Vibrio neptunius]MBN3548396.1 DUF2867 domain-containing protein [Vibrio neptunius]MBN3576442.1 DUF2867 domain-containing protein [Vibrio neptunius]MCH9870106.1 DUF2867 domain-containing protein [Vibrio neptunius]